jgi:hypothetical protein
MMMTTDDRHHPLSSISSSQAAAGAAAETTTNHHDTVNNPNATSKVWEVVDEDSAMTKIKQTLRDRDYTRGDGQPAPAAAAKKKM